MIKHSIEIPLSGDESDRAEVHSRIIANGHYTNSGKVGTTKRLCDSRGPSVVPQKPTRTNTWEVALLDPESRSYTSMAISHP